MKQTHVYAAVSSCLVLALLVTTVTFANQSSGEIQACVSKANGNTRILTGKLINGGCKKNETLVVWNKEGVPGQPGEAGPVGPAGPQGEPGVSGVDEARIAALEARIAELEGDDGGGDEQLVAEDGSISASTNSPDATTLLVEEDTTESDEYVVHVFNVVVDQDSLDLTLNDAFVWVTLDNQLAGAPSILAADVIADVYLTIAGQTERGSAVALGVEDGGLNHPINGGESNRTGFVFSFDGLTLETDTQYQAEVSVVLEGQDGGTAYQNGVTIKTDVVGAEWEANGPTIANVLAGTDISETHLLATVMPIISDVASSVERNESGTAGVISFEFTVEAESDVVELTIADIVTQVIGGNLPGIPALTLVAGDATEAGGTWIINEGDQATFVYDVVFSAVSTANNGSYRINLESILGVEIDETSGVLNLTFSS